MLPSGTIFRTLSMDRLKVQWESYIDDLTPVQRGERVWYKRDDYWAPLGYGGINGFKTRQAAWLFTTVRKKADGVLFAGSVKSTQHAMTAAVSRHYGLRSTHVLGATTPASCTKHEAVAIAAAMGAEFDIIKVAYTPALQRRLRDLADERPGHFVVEYGVGLDHRKWPADLVRAYHEIGAAQVANIPASIRTLVMPSGSCHAAVSVILGLVRHRRADISLEMVGIGPNRLGWMMERLDILGVRLRARPADGHIEVGFETDAVTVRGRYHDCLAQNLFVYHDMFDESMDGITFHPTYEAKVAWWLREKAPQLLNEETLIWIVGSAPQLSVMQRWAEGARSMD